MDAIYSGFLDDTSTSHTTKSPVKTSTVAKEDIKWNEDAFFKRQTFPEASESIFVTPVESPISASHEPVVNKGHLQKPLFDLNSISFNSDKANSSLGILNIENLSGLSGSSFQATSFAKKKKKKLKASSREKLARLSAASTDIVENLEENSKEENTDAQSNSSSDIEYDGTNIPELNMDCDILSLIRANKSNFNDCTPSNETDESVNAKSSTFTKNEKDLSEININFSELCKGELLNISQQKNPDSTRNSIFSNFRPSYQSLFEQIVNEGTVNSKDEKEKVTKTIKVCPFLDISSFEVEPMLHKSGETTDSSSIENTRCNQDLSVDFCPEQISARSSSFKSSRKYNASNSEISSPSFQNKSSFNYPSLLKEDLENEVLTGSLLQIPEAKFESLSNMTYDDKDSGNMSKGNSLALENVSENINKESDLPLKSSIQFDSSSGIDIGGESWCSQLGLSESDFFSSEAAKEMLKKDKEEFEKEQFLQTNKISGVSNWSPPSQLEVTAPSWFLETSPDQLLDSKRHISIGTLFRARSEKLGNLSDDKDTDRPSFGDVATTPPKTREILDSSVDKTDGNALDDKNHKNIRNSALSELLDNISLTDPLSFASKIVQKCISHNEKEFKKSDTSQANISENEHTFKMSEKSILNDIDESVTFMRSSENNISKETCSDTNVESKSTLEVSGGTTLNYSVNSASERESIKPAKCDSISNCHLPCSSQSCSTEEFSRPASVCSSICSNHIPNEKALSLQYGCMKYLNSGVEHNRNGIANSLPTGFCPHVCFHNLQSNLLPIGGCNPLQPALQNALSGSLFLSGASVSCNDGIQAPSELYFPEKIALGDSQEMNLTIRNSVNVAYYHFTCVSAYLNDSPLPEGMSGLNFCNTVAANTGNATDIKLIIAPKYEGKFEVNLQVDAFINSVGQTMVSTPPSATLKTKIQYTVVRPCISILYKGKSCLNLGTVIVGSSFVEYITIINNSEVTVPLRISLSNDTIENQIHFGLKEMDRQKHSSSGTLRFLSSKVLLYRMPASKNKNLPSSFDIPVVFESINGPLLSSITAAIETPTLFEVLGFIQISASVGNARLILKDTDQNPLVLKASKGATCSHSVTVMNDGSLSVVYDITIESDSDVFFVSPNSLNLQPKQCATISVTYTPQTYYSVEGKLLAAAEPHGQVFLLTEIIGHVQECYPRPKSNNLPITCGPTRPTRDSIDSINESSLEIECNKRYLAWGGSDIGQIALKAFNLRNPKAEPIHVKVFIKEKESGFMLLDESGQESYNYRQLTIDAKGAKDIIVVFIPKDVKSYSAHLYIKQVIQIEKKCFGIPLSGYGGTSKLEILNLPLGEKTDYCIELDPSVDAENVHRNIILHNTGLRPAFVNLVATDDNLVENVASKQICIKPSKFVLLEKEKKNILITVNDVQKSQISKAEIINILYGDEILRQRLKRISKSASSVNNSTYESFVAHFDGEEKVAFDSTYRSCPKDETLFFTSLKKIKIHVLYNGQNMSFSRTSFAPLSEIHENFSSVSLDSTIASTSSKLRRLTIENHSPPVKDSCTRIIPRISSPVPYCDNLSDSLNTDIISSVIEEMNNMKLNKWSISPDELVFDTENKEKRIMLKSHSSVNMKFKVECTCPLIDISPISGVLASKKRISLRLTLISNIHNTLFDDYYGTVKIMCDGEEKIITITVIKEKEGRSLSPSPILNDSLRSGFLGESFLGRTMLESTSKQLNVDNIYKFPKEIDLHTVKMGILSETILVVCNPTEETVSWNICPSSMLFTEPSDDSVDCFRSAIEFKNTCGDIEPMATENIVIKFFPQSAACFQQFFKLTLKSKNNSSQTVNVKVQGKAEADLPYTARYSDVSVKNKRSSTVKKRSKSELLLEKNIYKFPLTPSGQKSSEGVVIKNGSSQDFKVSIIKPQLPFNVNHSTCTIKSKKFSRIPVHFKPLKPGKFESEIKFVSDSGTELKATLIGVCSS